VNWRDWYTAIQVATVAGLLTVALAFAVCGSAMR